MPWCSVRSRRARRGAGRAGVGESPRSSGHEVVGVDLDPVLIAPPNTTTPARPGYRGSGGARPTAMGIAAGARHRRAAPASDALPRSWSTRRPVLDRLAATRRRRPHRHRVRIERDDSFAEFFEDVEHVGPRRRGAALDVGPHSFTPEFGLPRRRAGTRFVHEPGELVTQLKGGRTTKKRGMAPTVFIVSTCQRSFGPRVCPSTAGSTDPAGRTRRGPPERRSDRGWLPSASSRAQTQGSLRATPNSTQVVSTAFADRSLLFNGRNAISGGRAGDYAVSDHQSRRPHLVLHPGAERVVTRVARQSRAEVDHPLHLGPDFVRRRQGHHRCGSPDHCRLTLVVVAAVLLRRTRKGARWRNGRLSTPTGSRCTLAGGRSINRVRCSSSPTEHPSTRVVTPASPARSTTRG